MFRGLWASRLAVCDSASHLCDVARHEDVLRLDVAVEVSVLVHVAEALEDLGRQRREG